MIKQIASRWLGLRTAGVSTGDGKFVGFFVPLPPELVEQFPDLGEEDKSPTHFTFLIIGEVPPDKREEFLARSERILLSFRGPVHAELGGLDYFAHPAKERRVAYVSVKFNKNLADWRSRLYDLAIEMGLAPTDVSPLAYNPHITLEYMNGLYSRYLDPVPEGSWYFNSIQVWGLPQKHELSLGVSAANRVAVRQLKKKSSRAKPHAEKEDDEAERLVRKSPKLKPPRKDRRRERMETEHDPDVDTGDRGDDDDLSLNYKRIAHHWLRGAEKLYPHTTPTGKKTDVPWKSLSPEERSKYEDEKEQEKEDDDEKLSDQADEEVDAVAEASELYGDLKDMAQKRYEGILEKNPESKTTLEDVETFLKDRTRRSIRRMLDESKFDIGEMDEEEAKEITEEALSEAEQDVNEEIAEEETPKEDPSGEAPEGDAQPEEEAAPEEPDSSEPEPESEPDEAQEEEAQEQNDETIDELKEEVQEEAEKEEERAPVPKPDYSQPVSEMSSEQQSEHAKKSYKEFSSASFEERTSAATALADELEHISGLMKPIADLKKDLESAGEGSPEHAEISAKLAEAESKVVGAANRADQLDAELDGITLAQTLNDEEVVGRPKPSKAFTVLAKTLAKSREEADLLGTMKNIGSSTTQEKLVGAVGKMNDTELAEFSGGKDGPLGKLVEALGAKDEFGEPKFGRDHQNYLRDMLQEFAVDNMTINHQFIESVLKSADKSIRERLESGGGLADRLMSGDGLQSLYDEMAEGKTPEGEAFEAAQSSDRAALLKAIADEDKGKPGKILSGNVKKFQSSFNTPHNISRESKFLSTPDDDSCGEGHNNFHRRRITMSDNKGKLCLTKKAARNISAEMDRLAELFQNEYQTLGVPPDIANDFARRCDLLSDAVERNAGLEPGPGAEKQALTEYDPVDETKVAPHNFDPEEIGKEDAGPLEQEGDESFMKNEFTQQENRELRERVQDGDLGNDKLILEEQKPQAGKQATKKKKIAAIDSSLGRLSKLATGGLVFIRSLGELEDVLKICQAKLEALAGNTAGNLATQLSGLLGRHVAPLSKVRDQLTKIIGGGEALDAEASVAIDRIEVSIREVLPHVEDMIDTLRDISTDSSPVAILQSEEYLADASERVKKLLELSAKIVNDSSKVFVKAQKEFDKVEKELGLDDKTAAKKSEEDEVEEEDADEKKTSKKKAFSHGFNLFEE